jgi:transposase
VLTLPPAVKIFLSTRPADMRRSFDGLCALTRELLEHDPLSGHLFVFRNRRGDRLKILYWDRDGLAVWAKRLEKGTFRFPQAVDGRVEVTSAQLAMILEGIDVDKSRRRPRYSRPVAATPA